MPITQDRMLALLREAEDWREAYNRLKSLVPLQIEYAQQSGEEPAQTLRALSALALADQPPASERMLLERYHFDKNGRANARSARKMRRRRGQEDSPRLDSLTPRTAPTQTLDEAKAAELLEIEKKLKKAEMVGSIPDLLGSLSSGLSAEEIFDLEEK